MRISNLQIMGLKNRRIKRRRRRRRNSDGYRDIKIIFKKITEKNTIHIKKAYQGTRSLQNTTINRMRKETPRSTL